MYDDCVVHSTIVKTALRIAQSDAYNDLTSCRRQLKVLYDRI